jgi:hypothetical protein
MNFPEILAAARRSSAAYIDDTNSVMAAFQQLGYEFRGQYQDGSHQAVLSRMDDQTYLSISGTRFGRKIGDLLDDLDTKPFNIGEGALVALGAYSGLDDMFNWAKVMCPVGTVFTIDGHSLGGGRALFSPLFLPESQIGDVYAFESPKFANAVYWQKHPLDSAVHTVNGSDIFYGYPFVGSQWVHPARDVIWLKDSGFEVIQPVDWPRGLSVADHGIDKVIARLRAITET